MSWKRLDITDLKKILSDDEANALNTLGTTSLSAVNDTIDIVSDTWRGALLGKSTDIDTRDHYTPSSYHYWILVHARWAVWTRFPNSLVIALDDSRKAEYEKALELLISPSIAVDKPDEEHSKEKQDEANGSDNGSIKIPFLIQDGQYWWFKSR